MMAVAGFVVTVDGLFEVADHFGEDIRVTAVSHPYDATDPFYATI